MPVSQYPTRFDPAHSGEASGPDHLILIDVPPEYPALTMKLFKDGGAVYSLPSTNVVERWDLNYDGLSEEDAAILDNHRIEAMDQFESFSFRHPRTGILYTNVHYETYENPGHQIITCQSRHVVLVRRGSLVATSPTLLTNGFLLREVFADLDDWTSDGSWIVDSDSPAFVASAGSDTSVSFPGIAATSDAMGVREGIILSDGDTWYMLYDAGNDIPATSGYVWRMHMATSTDQGRSWTRLGPLSIVFAKTNTPADGDWASRACGYMERRGSTYYLHTIYTPNLATSEIPAPPYFTDVWSASSPLGPWTYLTRPELTAGSSGEFDDVYAYGTCIVEDGGTFHLFYGGQSGIANNVGIATGPSAHGPWTKVAHPDGIIDLDIAGDPENLKVFWDATIERWVMMANQIEGGVKTTINTLFISESLTDWSAAKRYDVQFNRPIDSSDDNVIGVPAPLYEAEGLPIFGVNGEVPFTYDGDSPDMSSGGHHDRKIKFSYLQPCPTSLHYPTQDAVLRRMSRSLNHNDFVAEYEIDASDGNDYAQVLFHFRMDGINGSAGYRLVNQFVVGAGQPDRTLQLYKRTAATTNHSLAATATASSNLGANYLPSFANDGTLIGTGNTAFWQSNTNTPDHWLQMEFAGATTISEIDVFTAQDTLLVGTQLPPTLAMTFTLFGITEFEVQYWNGSSWVTVTGGNVTGNNKVWRKFTFTPVSTTKVRVLVHDSIDGYGRIMELQAWGPPDVWALVATGTGNQELAPVADWADMRRIRLSAQSTTIKAWLDGELQFTYTADVLSGTAIAFGGFDVDAHIRDLKIYKTDSITLTNLTIGDVITLRGPGGVPLKQLTADSTTEVVSHTSWPITAVQAGERVFAPAAGIWGGSTIQFVS